MMTTAKKNDLHAFWQQHRGSIVITGPEYRPVITWKGGDVVAIASQYKSLIHRMILAGKIPWVTIWLGYDSNHDVWYLQRCREIKILVRPQPLRLRKPPWET